eukprot:TRINITY_DN12153_c0_g1_i1.p1 TRINITY_DN12153_c0_g1~~TRINITY_DN12153_c0_g1_i1.p1  ORF type:complete len:150 (+),score=64.33 TRINITY_DN12153_c0_g1_i1:27-452(+)
MCIRDRKKVKAGTFQETLRERELEKDEKKKNLGQEQIQSTPEFIEDGVEEQPEDEYTLWLKQQEQEQSEFERRIEQEQRENDRILMAAAYGPSGMQNQKKKSKYFDKTPIPPKDTPQLYICLLYTSPSPRDQRGSRMPSSA